MSVGLGFVRAWLTLRSQSVVPAAVSHARYNALVFFTHWADVCGEEDRKSTRLNSSHGYISYAVFCLKKKKSDYKEAARRQGSSIDRAIKHSAMTYRRRS